MTTKTLNPELTYRTQAGAPIQLRSYTRSVNGAALAPGTVPSSIELKEEFGLMREFPIPVNLCEVVVPRGTDSTPDELWSPGINGKRGYNLICNLWGTSNTSIALYENLYESLYGGFSVAENPLQRGWYRLRIFFSTGEMQEFSISVRD